MEQVEYDRGTRLRETIQACRSVFLAVPPTLIQHHQLVDVAERRGNGGEDAGRRLDDRRQLLEDRLEPRGVVEFLPRFRLAQDRGGFRNALRLDRFRLCKTDRFDLGGFRLAFRFDGGSAAHAFLAQLLLFRFGERDEG